MFEFSIGGVCCRLSLLFPALLTALLLWQPDGLAVSCVLASVIHECGHLLAMLAVGVPPDRCTLSAFGACIRMGSRLPGYRQNMLISLAGPLANLLAAACLLLLGCQQTAAVHLVLAVLNLLPASALDGGELLRCGLCLLGMESLAAGVLRFTSTSVLLPLAAGALWLFLRGGGNLSLLLVSGYLVGLIFFCEKNEKTS